MPGGPDYSAHISTGIPTPLPWSRQQWIPFEPSSLRLSSGEGHGEKIYCLAPLQECEVTKTNNDTLISAEVMERCEVFTRAGENPGSEAKAAQTRQKSHYSPMINIIIEGFKGFKLALPDGPLHSYKFQWETRDSCGRPFLKVSCRGRSPCEVQVTRIPSVALERHV